MFLMGIALGVLCLLMAVFTLLQLAQLVGGSVVGDGGVKVGCVRSLDTIEPQAICPVLRSDVLAQLPRMPDAVITGPQHASLALEAGVQACLVHAEPTFALARIIDAVHPELDSPTGIHPTAVVNRTARLEESVYVGPTAVIEADVVIGSRSWIGPGVFLGAGTKVGCHVRIGPGAVIGHEGFGYAPGPAGPVRVRHIGTVEIADFVEIGANTCVDRATLGVTRIGPHTKLDNLIQVGHNANIGARVLIAGQAGLAGSTHVGDDAMLGGQSGIADHVRIGERAKVAAKSGVTRHVPDDAEVAGYPAWPRRKWQRIMAYLSRLGGSAPADE